MATRPVIRPLRDRIKFWNILLYADSGTGKTVFAGSDRKVLFLAPEGDGSISAQRMGSQASDIEVTCWEDIKNAYEWYEAHPEELKDYDVLAIDSLSEMQYQARQYVLKMTAAEKIRKDQDPTKMQLQDYGIMHELVEQMVRGFNDLPINVLWTATAKKVKDPDENEFLMPEIQGKGDYGIAMKMVSLMTSYGYMRVELHDIPNPTEENPDGIKTVKRRVIYWEDTGTIRGKDRTCSLAPFTVNANLQQVRRTIAGLMKRDPSGRLIPANDARNDQPKKVQAKKPAVKTQPPAEKSPEKEPEEKLPESTHNQETGEKLNANIDNPAPGHVEQAEKAMDKIVEETLDIVEA